MKRPEESIIASNYAALVLRLTRAQGIDDFEVLKNTGVEPLQLDGSTITINGRQFLSIIQNAAALQNDDAFPVRYGVSMSIGTHGILGYALLTSATARDAFDLALRYHKTIFSMLDIREEKHDDRAHFIFDYDIDTGAMESIITEGIFAGLLSVAKFIIGYERNPVIMNFKSAEPAHAHLYEQWFGVTPRFGCPRNELIIDQQTLALSLPTHDPQTRKMAAAQCEKILESMNQFCSFPDRIKKIIKETPESLPTLVQVADKLHMHPRTLGRRLGEFNTCFMDLLEEVKSELAVQYLSDTNLLIDDIAYALNYNDTTSFYRAFKRWTGCSPSSFRPKGRAYR